jgi:hypothetical protein
MVAARHTFLFTDLVGFKALAAEQGDDRAAEVALLLLEHCAHRPRPTAPMRSRPSRVPARASRRRCFPRKLLPRRPEEVLS